MTGVRKTHENEEEKNQTSDNDEHVADGIAWQHLLFGGTKQKASLI